MHLPAFAARMRTLLILMLMLAPGLSFAQKKVTLSGYLHDAESGETLVGATVYMKETKAAAQTNSYGFYSISVPAGTYTAVYSYVGFVAQEQKLEMVDSKSLNIDLAHQSLKEVEVSARKDENVKNTEMGKITLSIERIKTLPVLFGEVDILKTLQLLPGVSSAGEGNAGFYVRGGGPDQNLVLLDEAVVYNTGHLFGFFSVFNSDAVKDVTLIKGGAPANYGGRLSSVVDVTMKDGNNKEFHAEGGIGLIASRLTLEGPLKKNKGSFLIAGRRTYIDVLTKPFLKGNLKGSGYYFYDLNLKADYSFSNKNKVFFSAYTGLDKFKFSNSAGTFKADIPWGNKTGTLRWNHLFSDKIFVNTCLIYNDYNFASSFTQNDFAIKLSSGIKDYNAKSDLDYYTSFHHHFKAGFNYIYHTFTPNQISGKVDTTVLNPDNALVKYAHEAGAYVMDDFDVTPWWRINIGVRYSWFGQVGPYTRYQYDNNGNKTDSAAYHSGELVKSYGGWEPRFNMRFNLNDVSSIKTSISKTYQYIHLLSNNGTTLPTDVWVPSTYVVQPEMAWQYSAGYFRNFLENKLETSVEVYYKDLHNQVQYQQGYVPNLLVDPETQYVFGKGKAYGAEFFINKTQGKFTGWIGYTLAYTNLTFPDLNNGQTFPAKYDQRHDISVVATYQQSKKWTYSAVFVYGSGTAITLPTSYYFVGNNLVEQYSKLNAYRLFPYHRLDLSAVYTPQHSKPRKYQGSWAFAIYNVYNRHNPYFLYVNPTGSINSSGGVKVQVEEVTIFPIIPSITYNFKF